MPGTQVSSDTFKRLALERIAEARDLLAQGKYSGAYYIAGYAVEFSLKAVIAKQFDADTLPDLSHVRDAFQHDPDKLLSLSGLKTDFANAQTRWPRLTTHWLVIKDWGVDSRYKEHDRRKAQSLITAIDGSRHSFLWWIGTKW